MTNNHNSDYKKWSESIDNDSYKLKIKKYLLENHNNIDKKLQFIATIEIILQYLSKNVSVTLLCLIVKMDFHQRQFIIFFVIRNVSIFLFLKEVFIHENLTSGKNR